VGRGEVVLGLALIGTSSGGGSMAMWWLAAMVAAVSCSGVSKGEAVASSRVRKARTLGAKQIPSHPLPLLSSHACRSTAWFLIDSPGSTRSRRRTSQQVGSNCR